MWKTSERETNAIQMVLTQEQRKCARFEGLMGEAARKYEQDMASLQQQQKWGRGRRGGGGGEDGIRVNSDGRLVTTSSLAGSSGGAVPFTVQAQHKARKEAEAKLKESNAKIIHLKNTVKILLAKLKSTATNEKKKATVQVGKIRQEMIWHERRSNSEISRLTGIVDSMGTDPDILKITTSGGKSPLRSSSMQTESMVGIGSGAGSSSSNNNETLLLSSPPRRRGNGGAGGSSSSSTHAPTVLSHIVGKHQHDPNKKWAVGVDRSVEYNVDDVMRDRFTQRVLIKARSEVVLSGDEAEERRTIDRGVSLPHIQQSLGRRRGGETQSPGGRSTADSRSVTMTTATDNSKRNNNGRSARLGYKQSSMLQRLELVGDIAAEVLSPSKMPRRRKAAAGSRYSSKSGSEQQHVEDATSEINTNVESSHRRRQGGGGGGGAAAKRKDLRKMYGV